MSNKILERKFLSSNVGSAVNLNSNPPVIPPNLDAEVQYGINNFRIPNETGLRKWLIDLKALQDQLDDHETRITALEVIVADHEARLIAGGL